ncbi:sugar phosphate isomerase/epimerase [Dysgonomonas sp. 521]|uniref:sugar phosphate isomerase/epimerase family protein n=1 Tax=Dysgonomonas sp. 521 TaxID=2302932 RepID=UPI0013CF9F7E|nr:sugar phosphate isomerase/epimerase [Dysgonomonas sp. 521]NDV93307.1 sugar phosphate isomerase/epimerase [Dysgonomonas sp. 521]
MRSTNYLFELLAFLLLMPNFVQAQKKEKKEVAIQLYSVRERIGSHVNNQSGNYNADYTGILKELAQMGYTAVESAGYHEGLFYGRKPEDFKRDVEAFGLKVLSSHCSKPLTVEELTSGRFEESMKWWDQCIAAHKAAGMTYIVDPWLSIPKTVKELKTYCDYYNEIGKRCKANGMKFGYHNHAHEFQKVENQVVMMDYMLENTNPEYVFFQMDVYWVVMGQNSPVDYFKKYPGRFTVLHIKDHREVGQSGMVGFDAIFRHADIAGTKHIVVEMEGYTESLEKGLYTSIDYLLNAPFVKASYNK